MSFTIGVNFENKSFRHDETFNGSYRFTYKKIKEFENFGRKENYFANFEYVSSQEICL